MWLNGTMQEILYEYSKETFTVAIYLITTPHAHMSGVYYLPISEIADHTNCSVDETRKSLAELDEIGFAKYDATVKIIWVRNMWRYQIGDPFNHRDNKYKSTISHLAGLPFSSLIGEFVADAGINFDDLPKGLREGLAKGHGKGPYPFPIPSPSLPDPDPSGGRPKKIQNFAANGGRLDD